MPATGQEYDFTIIAEEEYDDEIKSIDDEEENEKFGAPMMSALEQNLYRASQINYRESESNILSKQRKIVYF